MLDIELDDPHHPLRGSGKIMRHLRVTVVEDLARDEVRGFLRQARSLAGLPSPQGGDRDKVTTRVKHPVVRRKARRRLDNF